MNYKSVTGVLSNAFPMAKSMQMVVTGVFLHPRQKWSYSYGPLYLHSTSLTWNLKMMVSKRNLLFQGTIFGFHVKLWEGRTDFSVPVWHVGIFRFRWCRPQPSLASNECRCRANNQKHEEKIHVNIVVGGCIGDCNICRCLYLSSIIYNMLTYVYVYII